MEDFQDLMKAVDIAIQRPDVDPDRLGVTGGSYGGFMTAWITARDCCGSATASAARPACQDTHRATLT